MESTLPPDPFAALGVPSSATSADIKSAYRKLVLRCHPDKVADEALKKVKQEEFHKIQQAYELIGDDDKLQNYKTELAMEAARRTRLAQGGSRPSVDPRSARYDVRTAAPAGASTSYPPAGAYRHEERRPAASRSFEDDNRYYESRSKKYDTYEPFPKQSTSTRTSRPEKEPIRVTRVSDRTRSDRNKARDKEERRSRTDKFVHPEDDMSSNDEKKRYEADYKRRDEENRTKAAAAEARRKAESRRSYEDRETVKEKEPRRQRSDEREFDHHRKTNDLDEKEADARDYISRTRGVPGSERPSASRTTSTRDVRHETSYDSRRREPRSDTVRRSSARPRERQDSSGRVMPEIVEWDPEDKRVPPSFLKSSSSPADLHNMRATPKRSYTEVPRDSRRAETSPTPQFRRSETMPSSTSSRRKEEHPPRPSNLRKSESVPYSTSPPEAAYASIPHAQPQSSSSRKYYYPTASGGGVEPVDVANGRPTVLREPNRHRQRSPSPLSRPPIGQNRRTEAPAPPRTTSLNTPPQMQRSQTFVDNERGRRLFGETTPDALRRAELRRETSYSPEKVLYAKKINPEDISWSSHRSRDDYTKPSLSRSTTLPVY